jgi:hypothetical protein
VVTLEEAAEAAAASFTEAAVVAPLKEASTHKLAVVVEVVATLMETCLCI